MEDTDKVLPGFLFLNFGMRNPTCFWLRKTGVRLVRKARAAPYHVLGDVRFRKAPRLQDGCSINTAAGQGNQIKQRKYIGKRGGRK